MQSNEEERYRKVKIKANFYFVQKLSCHILIVPSGFRNGNFDSNLIDDQYYWFIDARDKLRIRLFLADIFDIKDYRKEIKNEGNYGN